MSQDLCRVCARRPACQALADLFRNADGGEQGRRKTSACGGRGSRLAQASWCTPGSRPTQAGLYGALLLPSPRPNAHGL